MKSSWWNWIFNLFKRHNTTEEKIRAMMATEIALLPDLVKVRDADLKNLRTKYNTIYCVLDLPDASHGGHGKVREYIMPGRTLTCVTDIAIRNIKLLNIKYNFQVMVTACNEPSVRKGLAKYMSGWNYQDWSQADWYSQKRLAYDKAVYKDLIEKAGGYIHAIVLYLEPSRRESIEYCKELARTIRGEGWKGKLYTNGIGAGYWAGDSTLNVRKASSINDWTKWKDSTEDLKNADGMIAIDDASHAKIVVPELTKHAGRDGFILWFQSFAKSLNEPGKLQRYMYEYVYTD
jgi:hypothetical protein